jgi:hypothetical protein
MTFCIGRREFITLLGGAPHGLGLRAGSRARGCSPSAGCLRLSLPKSGRPKEFGTRIRISFR